VFFFAMIFAISMDYTMFLLSSAKEHRDQTHSAKDAMVGGVAHSGRVIFAAAAVMVAVFFTFALIGNSAGFTQSAAFSSARASPRCGHGDQPVTRCRAFVLAFDVRSNEREAGRESSASLSPPPHPADKFKRTLIPKCPGCLHCTPPPTSITPLTPAHSRPQA
jgi:hypothetical protein